MKRIVLIFSVLILVFGTILGAVLISSRAPSTKMQFEEFIDMVERRQVSNVTVYPESASLTIVLLNSDQEYFVQYPRDYPLSQYLIEHDVYLRYEKPWYMKYL
ncbi:MAG: ATP-dependent metallopeptidase FtsH/Yme1/Tma family protein [Thermoleophilia bacterium]